MKIIKKLGLTLALASVMALSANAAVISGSVSFSSNGTGAQFWTGGVGVAAATLVNGTSLSFGNGTGIVDVDEGASFGSYGGLNNLVTANFSAITMGAVGTTGPLSINPLWTLVGGNAPAGATFALLSVTTNSYDGTFRLIKGTGIATIGSDSAAGLFTFSTSGLGTTVSFEATTSVPDGGSSIMLLGLGFVGLAGMRRWFQKK